MDAPRRAAIFLLALAQAWACSAQPVSAPGQPAGAVYVSTAGSDTNPGTPALPVRTLAHAKALLRPGGAMLLRTGDTWHEQIRGLDIPATLASYGGGPRPVIESGLESGVLVWGSTTGPLSGVTIRGIEFVGAGTAAIDWTRPGDGLVIEDCRISGYEHGIIVQGFPGVRTNTVIRRTIVFGTGRPDPNSGGVSVYLSQYDGVLIEGCVFDHDPADPGGRYLSHHLYIGEGNPGRNIIRDNLARGGGRTNYNIRSGGLIAGNLSYQGAQGITVGISYAPAYASANIVGNVITESRNNSNGQLLGFGISLDRVDGVTVAGNLIFNGTAGGDHKAIALAGDCARVTIAGNTVYNWQSADPWGWDTLYFSGAPRGPVLVLRNRLQQFNGSVLVRFETPSLPPRVAFAGNLYWSQWPGPWVRDNKHGYAPSAIDPLALVTDARPPCAGRTVSGYSALLGRDLFAAARDRAAGTWPVELSAPAVCAYLWGR